MGKAKKLTKKIKELNGEIEFNYSLVEGDLKRLDEKFSELEQYTDAQQSICAKNIKIIGLLTVLNISFSLICFLILHRKDYWIFQSAQEHPLESFQVRPLILYQR